MSDGTPVVRCKECIFSNVKEDTEYGYCHVSLLEAKEIQGCNYCSLAVKRNEKVRERK